MKKVMILGAGIYQVPIIKKAMEMGFETIAVSPDGNYPGLKIADKVYNIDVRDGEAILKIAREEGICGITTDQTDIAVRTVAYVAEKMGIPGIGFECAKLFTDKYLMRAKTTQLGLPTIPFKMVGSYEEAESFFKEIGGDVIIKPVDNQGSRGIFFISSIEMLKDHFEESKGYSASGNVIIEKHIKGPEFEVDSILVDYEEKTLMYAATDLYDIPDVFASRTRLYPSVADDKVVEKLLKLNHDIITGFGLKQGLTHSEYIMDEEDGEIYLIEAAARGGGSFISSDIARLQTGVDTSQFLIELATGTAKSIPEFDSCLCHCGYVTFYLPEGVVEDVTGIEEVKALPFVKKHLLDDIYVGLETESFSDKSARNVIISAADSREGLLANIEKIKELLQIKVKTTEGTKGPIWE